MVDSTRKRRRRQGHDPGLNPPDNDGTHVQLDVSTEARAVNEVSVGDATA